MEKKAQILTSGILELHHSKQPDPRKDKTMADLSATRAIKAVMTPTSGYYVGVGSYDKITITEKSGDMAYVIWYQLWKNGEVVKEVNSLLIESIDYFPTKDTELPF